MTVVQQVLRWLQGFVQTFAPYLNRFVIFFLILFIGFLVGKILGRLAKKLLADVKADTFFRTTLGIKFSAERAVSGAITSLIYLASIVLAFNSIGFTAAALEIVVAIIILLLIFALFLAIKETLRNTMAGLQRQPMMKPGAYIRLDELEGEITETTLLDTVIATRSGDTVIVPNSFFQRRMVRLLKRKPAKKNSVAKRT